MRIHVVQCICMRGPELILYWTDLDRCWDLDFHSFSFNLLMWNLNANITDGKVLEDWIASLLQTFYAFHTCLCKTWPRYPAASNARCEGPSYARNFPFCLANGRLLCFGYTFCFFHLSLSLTFDWLGAAGNTNTTHLQLRTSSGFCPSNIRLPTNQNEPTKSREIQSFADRRITRDMPHAVLHAWGRQARPRRTKHQRCCPPKLKPQSARKSKQ